MYYSIADRKSGKTCLMKWNTAAGRPSKGDAEQFIWEQENKTIWTKLNKHIPGDRFADYLNTRGQVGHYAVGGVATIFCFGLLFPIGAALARLFKRSA